METDQKLIEILERFERYDWTQYHLDVIDRAESNRLDFESSNLNNNYKRLNRRTVSDFSRLTRMPSSTSMKHNRPVAQASGFSSEGLSSQVVAKYASLIETMSNSNRTGVTRTSSHNSRLTSEPQRQPPAERPTRLFGPLRREDGRRNSAEPSSLPYSINNNVPRDVQPAKYWTRPANDIMMDETPVKRIVAPEKPFTLNHEKSKSTNDDEDDFDITNLLSITVLSDIKTIRQDLASIGRQSSNLSRPTAQRGARVGDVSAKMPARSRTSLEFEYNHRRNQADYEYRRTNRRTFHQTNNYHQSLDEPESLPYGWGAMDGPDSYQAPQERAYPAPTATTANVVQKKDQPIDEKVSQIIESFKAEVKARARAPLKDVTLKTTATVSTTTTSANINSRTNKADEADNKPPRTSDNKPEDQRQVSAVEGVVKDEASTKKTAGECGATSEEVTKVAATLKRTGISSIPRLVSLHRPQSNVGQESGTCNMIAVTAKVTPSGLLTKSNATATGLSSSSTTTTSTTTTTSSSSGKIVSRYKELRGKSLADEVDELKK